MNKTSKEVTKAYGASIRAFLKNPKQMIFVSCKSSSTYFRSYNFVIADGCFLNKDMVDLLNDPLIRLDSKTGYVKIKGVGSDVVSLTLSKMFEKLGLEQDPTYILI